MKKILVASTNPIVTDVIKSVCLKYSAYFDPLFCPDTDEALCFIDYEIPEIKIIDFTSKDINCEKILQTINSDPWLHNGGVIAVVSNPLEVQSIEESKNPNILTAQTVYTFKTNFERLLRILWSNKQFLFNRGMQEFVGGIEKGGFVCKNDPFDLRMFTSFLVNYLYCTNRIDENGRYSLQTTLMELLTNALEHGNCGISYDEKTKYLESGRNVLDLIHEKLLDENISKRKINIEYVIGKEKSSFKISDEGDGFDWRSRMNSNLPKNDEMHGRGINLSKELVSKLTYNDKGNEVSFEIKNLHDASNTVPLVMQPFSTITYQRHQIVFKQNEFSNDLFFIRSGEYGVYVDGKLISVLTPKDMFIGEMAFLLNDRRSATIMSAQEGQLIRIPKSSFLNLIRKNPHYGIFLSKLLAQRIVRQNQKFLKLTNELKELKEKSE